MARRSRLYQVLVRNANSHPLWLSSRSNFVWMFCEGRMEDKSSNVRKAAMQLLMTLLQFNPFGPVLEEPRLAATLAAHAAKLQVRKQRPAKPASNPTAHVSRPGHAWYSKLSPAVKRNSS